MLYHTFVTVHSSDSCIPPLEFVPVLVLVVLLDMLFSSRTRPPRCQIPAAGSPPPRLCTTHSPPGRVNTTLLLLLLLLLEEHSGRRKLRERSDGAPWKPAAGTNARAKGDAEASMETAHELQALMVLVITECYVVLPVLYVNPHWHCVASDTNRGKVAYVFTVCTQQYKEAFLSSSALRTPHPISPVLFVLRVTAPACTG